MYHDKQYEVEAFMLWEDAKIAVFDRLKEHFSKYGAQRLGDGDWVKVIVEEEGEAVQAINKLQYEEAYKEIAQTIACWVRLWYEVKRMESGKAEEEQALGLYGRAK